MKMIRKEKLEKWYLERKYSCSEIAKKVNCPESTIYSILKFFGIKIRSRSEALLGLKKKKKADPFKKEDLKKIYLQEKKSMLFIAKLFDCSETRIYLRLKQYGIRIRSRSEANIKIARSSNIWIKCSCGCEKKLRKYSERGYERIFCPGHYFRVKRYSMIDEKDITEFFLSELSMKQISKIVNLPVTTVRYILEKNKIRRKNKHKIIKGLERKIVKLYLFGLKMSEVGKKIGFSGCTVGKFLRKNNVKIRKPQFYPNWRKSMSESNKRRGHRPPYLKGSEHGAWKGGKIKINCTQCSKILEKYPASANYSKHHFCSQKCQKEWLSKNLRGERNPFFGKKHSLATRRKISLKHGGNGNPYEFSEYGSEFDCALKEKVRFRDKYVCLLCGCSQLENGKLLDVHHINYIKRDNELNNLVSLCVSCHRKTNWNRKYYTILFQKYLLKKEDSINIFS